MNVRALRLRLVRGDPGLIRLPSVAASIPPDHGRANRIDGAEGSGERAQSAPNIKLVEQSGGVLA